MQDAYNGTVGEVIDDSIFAHNGTGGDLTGDTSTVPGLDDGASCRFSQLFSGRQTIDLPQDSISGRTLTVSAWVRLTEDRQELVIYSRGDSFQFGTNFLRWLTATVWLDVDGVATSYIVFGTSKRLELDRWYRVACTLSASQLALYCDGVLVGSMAIPATASLVSSTADFAIGSYNQGRFWNGDIQDLWITGNVRSANWLKAEHDAFCSPNFITVDPNIYDPTEG